MKAFVTGTEIARVRKVMTEARVSLAEIDKRCQELAQGLDAQGIGPAMVGTSCGKVFPVNINEMWWDQNAVTIAKPINGLVMPKK